EQERCMLESGAPLREFVPASVWPRKNARCVPHTVAAALHVVAEQDVPRADGVPVAGRLPPAMDAFFRRFEQTLSWPAFGADFASQQAAGKLGIDGVEAAVPVVVPLQRNAGLVPGVAFGFASEDLAEMPCGARRLLSMGSDRKNQRPLRQRGRWQLGQHR